MKVLISGGSGLVGTALTESLRSDGHAVAHLVRPGGAASAGDMRWDPASGFINVNAMEAADAVVNLNGASIGGGRWTPERKKILRSQPSGFDALSGGHSRAPRPEAARIRFCLRHRVLRQPR